MCRLVALTTTELQPGMRRLFFNQLMLYSAADGPQTDGAGITDGNEIFKGYQYYLIRGPEWIKRLDDSQIWLGHVRAASRNTEVSNRAAHPYLFRYDIGGEAHWLYAAHNGGINGTGDQATILEPNVDSYRAFKRLATLLSERNAVTPSVEIMNEWTSTFGIGSQWTFMFMVDNGQKIWIARGTRSMHYMTLNDGLVFNTSWDALANFKGWVYDYWAKSYTVGKIESIPEYMFTEIDMASHKVITQPLDRPAVLPDETGRYLHLNKEQSKLLK